MGHQVLRVVQQPSGVRSLGRQIIRSAEVKDAQSLEVLRMLRAAGGFLLRRSRLFPWHRSSVLERKEGRSNGALYGGDRSAARPRIRSYLCRCEKRRKENSRMSTREAHLAASRAEREVSYRTKPSETRYHLSCPAFRGWERVAPEQTRV